MGAEIVPYIVDIPVRYCCSLVQTTASWLSYCNLLETDQTFSLFVDLRGVKETFQTCSFSHIGTVLRGLQSLADDHAYRFYSKNLEV